MSLELRKNYPESLKNVKPTFMRTLKSGDVVIDETGDGKGDLIIATPNTDIQFYTSETECKDEPDQTKIITNSWGRLSKKAVVIKFINR